jgi:predicted N-formylglutamate amidohydrolase
LPQTGEDLGAIVPAAVENAAGAGPFVVICDHASNALPPAFGSLGIGAAEREAHIAWDPGALGVSRAIAKILDAPLVYATVSRLVIDCNRPLDAPDLIPAVSEATAIPGNAGLSEAERRRRIATVHEPYHDAIDALLDIRLAAGMETALVAVHSFTPRYRGVARPWQAGIIFDRDRRLADVLIDGLTASGANVGINEPYSPADRVYYTLSRHGEARGLAAVMIEIRNDLIRGEAEQQTWAERIGAHLASHVPSTGESGGALSAEGW